MESVKAAQAERQKQLESADLFDASLHIHQAVPAKDTNERWVGGGSGLSHAAIVLSAVPLPPAVPLRMLWSTPTPWWSG